jgi:uncharacterized membrane protein YphA (DoxX/SURF4 family)
MIHTTEAAAIFVAISPFVYWPYSAGAALLLIGLFAMRAEIEQAFGLYKVVVLSRLFVAVPLAVFSGEHLSAAKFVMLAVPSWMPWRLFWAYFVGFALLAAALSFVTKIQARWAGLLLGIMIFLFVLSLHVPKVVANPHDRIAWAVAVRDSSFAGGAWILAGTQTEEWKSRGTHKLITLGRFLIGIAAVFFAIEHFLHPEFCPGVPLGKATPVWIPARALLGYFTGVVLLVAGTCILLGKKVRMAATYLGLEILLLVLFVYLPILVAVASDPNVSNKIEGLNYFADTLMFGGTVLILAYATPTHARTE